MLVKRYFIELCRLCKINSQGELDRHISPYLKLYQLPYSIQPEQEYGEDIWELIETNRSSLDKRISYRHAKVLAKCVGVKSQRDWTGFIKEVTENYPFPFPHNPANFYQIRGQWESWAKFLGSNRLSVKVLQGSFISYEDAKLLICQLDVNNVVNYQKLLASKLLSKSVLPTNPDKFYKEWESWKVFLAPKYVNYEEARRLVRIQRISTRKKFQENRPERVPSAPYSYYEEWSSWPSFLGTD